MKLLWLKVRERFSRLVNLFRTRRIRLVDDQNLDELLATLGQHDRFRNADGRCSSCKQIVTKENFGAVYRDGTQFHFLCDDHGCLADFLER